MAGLLVVDVTFAFQQTAVIPAIPTIEKALGTSQAWGAWLLSGYLMASCVATPLVGRLADQHGRKRLLLAALAVFVAGSAGAAVSPTIVALVVCRCAQGVGGAVFPLTFSIARDHLPAERLPSTIGLLTGGFGVGTAIGFAVSGLLTSAFGWPAIFAVGAGALLVATILAAALVGSAGETPTPGVLDLPGAVLLSGSLVALLLALTLGSEIGWDDPVPWVLFALTPVCGALWWWREHAVPDPLVDLHTLRRSPVLWSNVATLALGYVLFASYYLVPHLADTGVYGFTVGPALVGLLLLPSAVGQLVAGPLAGAVAARIGPRAPLVSGLVLIAVAAAALVAGTGLDLASMAATMLVLGTGAGAAISSGSSLVSKNVPAREAGVASALNSTARRLGGGIGGQVSAVFVMAFGGPANAMPYLVSFAAAAAIGIAGVAAATRVPRRGAGGPRAASVSA